jgi:hypothetical protein
VDCPKIQDPRYSYGNPGAAKEDSENQIDNTERAIQGFDQTVPNNLAEGFAMKLLVYIVGLMVDSINHHNYTQLNKC